MPAEFGESVSSGAEVQHHMVRLHQVVDHGEEDQPILPVQEFGHPLLREQLRQGIVRRLLADETDMSNRFVSQTPPPAVIVATAVAIDWGKVNPLQPPSAMRIGLGWRS